MSSSIKLAWGHIQPMRFQLNDLKLIIISLALLVKWALVLPSTKDPDHPLSRLSEVRKPYVMRLVVSGPIFFYFFFIYNFYPGSGSGYACSSPTASILHVVLVQISIVRIIM